MVWCDGVWCGVVMRVFKVVMLFITLVRYLDDARIEWSIVVNVSGGGEVLLCLPVCSMQTLWHANSVACKHCGMQTLWHADDDLQLHADLFNWPEKIEAILDDSQTMLNQHRDQR